MNKPKSNKGITLVALIITVIVLLILTVVAIRAITGDGVLDKAKTATNSYEDKRREEENILGSYANMIDANIPSNNGNLNSKEEENIRQALEDMMFKGNSTNFNTIMQNGGQYWYSFIQESPWVTVDVIEIGSNMYAYYPDYEAQTVQILDSSNQYYVITEQFKTDLVKLRNTFVGKNIEDFEQEKTAEDSIWKLKNIESLEVEELNITVGNNKITFSYNGITVKYELSFESLAEVEGKLIGKIIGLAQDL